MEEPLRATSISSAQQMVCTQRGQFVQKNDQEIWNGDLIKKMRGRPWDPRAEGQSRGIPGARGKTPAADQMEHEHKESQTVLGRNGQDRRMCGMCKPKGKQTQCCLFESTGGVEKQDNASIRARETRRRHGRTNDHT